MALPAVILNNFTTADGVSYALLNAVWFDKDRVPQVQENGGGAAELVQDAIGRIRVSEIFRASIDGNNDRWIETVLNTDDTYSTPNAFIDAEQARLQAQIDALEAQRQ